MSHPESNEKNMREIRSPESGRLVQRRETLANPRTSRSRNDPLSKKKQNSHRLDQKRYLEEIAAIDAELTQRANKIGSEFQTSQLEEEEVAKFLLQITFFPKTPTDLKKTQIEPA